MLRDYVSDDGLPGVLVGDVEVVVAAANRGGGRTAFGVEDIGEGNRCAFVGEEPRLGGALPARGAGNQSDLSIQASGHEAPPS